MFQAVLISKPIYDMSSTVLTAKSRNDLDVCHLKGLRTILKITATFMDQSHANADMYEQASNRAGHAIHQFSTDYMLDVLNLLIKVTASPEDNPERQTILGSNDEPNAPSLRRPVGPKTSWYNYAMGTSWQACTFNEGTPDGATAVYSQRDGRQKILLHAIAGTE